MIVHRRRYQSPAAPICPHCGKELPETPGTFWAFVGFMACVFAALACMILFLGTVMNWVEGQQDTLWHSIQNTANAVGSLARRLW